MQISSEPIVRIYVCIEVHIIGRNNSAVEVPKKINVFRTVIKLTYYIMQYIFYKLGQSIRGVFFG